MGQSLPQTLFSPPLSPRFEHSLRLEPAPSVYLTRTLGLVHGLALLGALANGLPPWLKAALVLFIVLHLISSRRVRDQLSLGRGLYYESNQGWSLRLEDGSVVPVRILPTSRVLPGLVVLHLVTPLGRRQGLIVRDSLAADDFRRLKIALRIHGSSKVAASPTRH